MRTNILQAKKALLALFAAMLMPLLASAYDFEVDGIYYNIYSNLFGKTAEVTSGSSKYSGSITIPATVTYEGVDYSVTGIEDYAFDNCTDLKRVIIEDGSSTLSLGYNDCHYSSAGIGEGLFYDCPLEEVYLGRTLSYSSGSQYGYSPFYKSNRVPVITLGNSIKTISSYLFYGNTSLTAITIPKSVTSIENYAFDNCYSLKEVTFEDGSSTLSLGYNYYYSSSSTSEGEGLFHDCPLKKVYLGRTLSYSSSSSDGYSPFYNKTGLTSMTIGEKVSSIEDYAFYGCRSLTEISIPDGVRSIGDLAFGDCRQLLSLHIGPNVDSYEDLVFWNCDAIEELTVMGNIMPEILSENLTSITLYSPIPLKTTEFAAKVYRNATLNIPNGSLTRYQSSNVWKNFWYVNEFDPKKGKDIFLIINQADNGYVKQHLTEGTECSFTIVAAEGWKIHSVTFNGEEVTAQLTEEGTFNTPALSEDAVLNIAYEKIEDDTMVANARASRIKVQGHQGTLSITGTTEGDTISVYTTDGILVTRETAEASETEFILPTGQVYIVTTGDKVVKIAM